VALICALFFGAGIAATIYHGGELARGLSGDLLGVLAIRVLAVIGAVFAWRGAAWARWVLLAWMAAHVLLSGLHNLSETAAHAVLLMAVAFGLFNRRADKHFSHRGD
jgi:hypothetical protein